MFVLLLTASGCKTGAPIKNSADPFAALTSPRLQNPILPSNHRDWKPDQAVLPYAEFNGELVTVYNIRNCIYQTDDDYVVNHYDRTFDLGRLESVDFIVVPFKDAPTMAHTMLSFGFGDGQYLGVSVEARLEQGEKYSPLMGALRQFELMYVVADERDLIVRRTKYRDADVYLYRTTATPQRARELFVDVMRRVSKLAREPEFYDTLTNNCTTNIVRHINRVSPGRVPDDIRVLLPGFSDRLAYEIGLLDTKLPFDKARRQAHINRLANRYPDSPDFSARIRH